jgi:hypothetical protein
MGATAGAISLAVLHRQVFTNVLVPGASMILGPICTGALMNLLGRWWVRRGNVRMALFTFWGAFCFALGMASVRFAYFERPWTWLYRL